MAKKKKDGFIIERYMEYFKHFNIPSLPPEKRSIVVALEFACQHHLSILDSQFGSPESFKAAVDAYNKTTGKTLKPVSDGPKIL